jgi:hypothetical protein
MAMEQMGARSRRGMAMGGELPYRPEKLYAADHLQAPTFCTLVRWLSTTLLAGKILNFYLTIWLSQELSAHAGLLSLAARPMRRSSC